MPDLPEHSSPKAARILTAAGELLINRGSKGVTIAEVAQKAHIGKGTVYLYWKTKEDLLLGLVCRDFLALANEVIAEVTADPDLARPSRLCPRMLRHAAEHPFVTALQRNDDYLLGVLADDPRSERLLDTLGPDALMDNVLPIWRTHGLARTDWPLADQALALHALTTGFAAEAAHGDRPQVDDPERVLAAAVTALLGPEQASAEQVASAAAAGIRQLTEGRATALNLISPSAVAVSTP
ncbi:transcriptional regulator, TetR family [Prauserella aidingensis]|uniref:TetR/AcrR family transcriptional regulator n=1 Tax=Prauserella aidingensis TaxID=387890 RepID=UPI0020A5B9FF|nr:TetR/AcrR family transcriptional regulator [Prauserella aidingensis]MCP2256133.1 transcriptional regulator, TetR family [Prauserella aidingensis]